MITQDEMERALRWMACCDTEFADWRVASLRAEYMADVAESLAYKLIEGGSVEDRKKAAKASPEVKKAMEDYFTAVRGYEILRAQRKTAELLIETWRSVNANRRVGNV
ncbi:MAG: hypothetical protein JWO52_3323 [Gammaproteobacteria bacterium]|nr:hypothetical protein [Gammaproteobacteria bacterium]